MQYVYMAEVKLTTTSLMAVSWKIFEILTIFFFFKSTCKWQLHVFVRINRSIQKFRRKTQKSKKKNYYYISDMCTTQKWFACSVRRIRSQDDKRS